MNGIAISGRAGAGKSRLASEFVRMGYHRHAFADSLKQEVFRRYGLVKTDPGGREKLLEVGEARRNAYRYYWIERLLVAVENKLGRHPIVIDDVRTTDEAEWCRARGFLLVRVEAPLCLRAARLAAQGLDPGFALSTAQNEVELEGWTHGWDNHVWNNATARLAQEAHRILADAGVGEFTHPSRRLLLPH